ncbi:hypothetical protein D0867_05462 [Hortaea werneckii]|uniref:FAS1 domain-containing protein n=1 Tax=Hortaea werneckii TaxID=91943 RepID=A0A3M6ZT37_HORWE|nr:hypothetical protein D0867_05462 [Hortaea werneckii]RMY33964.1 hypothetical protein D0866_05572 [Hortaea werneckii]
MQYKLLTVSALAASAFAVPQASQTQELVSVLQVLQTALPSSLVAEALTNSAAVSSEIASQFSAGETPTWFTALPSDVQTYLVPLATNSAAASSALANITAAAPNATLIAPTTGMANMTAVSSGMASSVGSNSTAVTSVSRGTLGSSSATSGSGSSSTSGSDSDSDSGSGAGGAGSSSGSSGSSDSSSSSSSSAGASMPTAVMGAGIMGAAGIVGLFAL